MAAAWDRRREGLRSISRLNLDPKSAYHLRLIDPTWKWKISTIPE